MRVHISLFALLPESKYIARAPEADRSAPPDDRQVVLGLRVAPPAHPQAKVHERPVERLGCQDIFLVRIGDERVVRGHHGNVQMPKVPPEWRSIILGIPSRY